MEKELDQLYDIYGFKKHKTVANVCLYLFEKGRYFGADIIPLAKDKKTLEECNSIKQEYSDAGYAAQVREIQSVKEAANGLYKSFFSYNSTLSRLKGKYKGFTKAQSESNGGSQYKYISSPFQINNEPPLSNNIIDEINEILKIDSPQLIIIEAAAGYGKTCTSFEILNSLTENDSCDNPIITELSRNRGASIFRYILLDEIDREYPSLDSTLVKHEIRTGRIPLIIDGFDELLNSSELVAATGEVFNEVEPMLDTIGKLLTGSSKIILTTRKTAIFGGSEFRDWYSRWDESFSVNRFSIEVPKIKDWIGRSKHKLVKENNIPMEQIANPVLLTYLMNLSPTDFQTHISEPDLIVKKYFYSLMEREKTRQDLFIDPDDQYAIFKNVAKMMVQFDVSSEKRQFMKEIIELENRPVLEKALKSYPGNPTIDTLTDKLVNHAILDRKGREENSIGFINEFIFGNFIGEIMCETNTKEITKDFSAYMVDLGATAYRVQNEANKSRLWEKIHSLKNKFPSNILFNFDVTLKGELLRNIKDCQIQTVQVYGVDFNLEKLVTSTVFINCKFKNCIFNAEAFSSITFIQCTFDSCSVEGAEYIDINNNDNTAIKCTQIDGEIFYYGSKKYMEDEYAEDIVFQNEILSKLITLEKEHKGQKFMRLVNAYAKNKRRKVKQEIQVLADNKTIKINGVDMYIAMNKIKEVENRIKNN